MWDEERTRDLARRSHGLVDRKTVLRHGATDETVRTELRRGRWIRVHPGVYYLNVTPRTWHTDVLAAVLAAGPDALATHRTASRLWRLEGVGGRVIEVTVPHDGRPGPSGVLVHRTRRPLPGADTDGIPITSPERTLLDLAAFVPRAVLEKAYMSALHQKHTTPDLVAAYVEDFGGRGVRGTRKLKQVVPLADEGITASGSEVELRQIIRTCPIPAPALQLRVALPIGGNAYPDFSWPDRMKIVEVDGYDAHSTPEQLHDDLIRQNALMDLGWEIRRFSGRRIRREPLAVGEEITRFVLSTRSG